jgi:hypothetical protein
MVSGNSQPQLPPFSKGDWRDEEERLLATWGSWKSRKNVGSPVGRGRAALTCRRQVCEG